MSKNKKRRIFIIIIVVFAVVDNIYIYTTYGTYNMIYIASFVLLADLSWRMIKENENGSVTDAVAGE